MMKQIRDLCFSIQECVMKHHPEVLMLLLKRFDFDYKYMTYVKDNQSVNVRSTLQIPQVCLIVLSLHTLFSYVILKPFFPMAIRTRAMNCMHLWSMLEIFGMDITLQP